ncbi:hypothetical protein EDC18_101445 [Natranaerovirga pectinivora]|uniref:G-protein coupled receptors family 3 profile domain-containing protein n=1 Tax=Natranaerovirga pectinivora TaxID=682400 RepID=A0A4R3MPB9_9FIRM|nr:hypothetical protein [Natranaerovirga pectinivora]TCT17147.1 hypothetical protein EDC18_101445 [Natranaerovirga pectinivora]
MNLNTYKKYTIRITLLVGILSLFIVSILNLSIDNSSTFNIFLSIVNALVFSTIVMLVTYSIRIRNFAKKNNLQKYYLYSKYLSCIIWLSFFLFLFPLILRWSRLDSTISDTSIYLLMGVNLYLLSRIYIGNEILILNGTIIEKSTIRNIKITKYFKKYKLVVEYNQSARIAITGVTNEVKTLLEKDKTLLQIY